MKRDMDQATKQFPATPVEVEDIIRRRAYADGFELDDWVQAEAEVLGSREMPKAAVTHRRRTREAGRIVRSSLSFASSSLFAESQEGFPLDAELS